MASKKLSRECPVAASSGMEDLVSAIKHSWRPTESDGLPIGCPGFTLNSTGGGCKYYDPGGWETGVSCLRDPDEMERLRETREETDAQKREGYEDSQDFFNGTGLLAPCAGILRRFIK
ncbi:hypothetical protein FWC31_00020 [Candidatus Saccharibacteria bacterium]|nr:hypothetical protein [Candidatus Saccharibacteria bacterium]